MNNCVELSATKCFIQMMIFSYEPINKSMTRASTLLNKRISLMHYYHPLCTVGQNFKIFNVNPQIFQQIVKSTSDLCDYSVCAIIDVGIITNASF